jgi:hypothetical protein
MGPGTISSSIPGTVSGVRGIVFELVPGPNSHAAEGGNFCLQGADLGSKLEQLVAQCRDVGGDGTRGVGLGAGWRGQDEHGEEETRTTRDI